MKNKKTVALRALCGNKEFKELEKLKKLENNPCKSAIKNKKPVALRALCGEQQ